MGPAAVQPTSPARVPRALWPVALTVALSLVYLVINISSVRPYLWPAGHGFRIAGDSRLIGASDERPIFARPPAIDEHPVGATIVRDVLPRSAAERAGLREGDVIVEARGQGGRAVDFRPLLMAEASDQVEIWRRAYRLGPRGPLELTVERDAAGGVQTATVRVDRAAAWSVDAETRDAWSVRHFGQTAQAMVFILFAAALLWLRPRELTADLAVLALTLSAVGNAGPLLGAEQAVPLAWLLTVFAWVAAPLAFPSIALAILYFPSRSPLLERHRWLHALPFAAAFPMIAASTLTGLYLSGVDALRGAAIWDALHPGVYYASFGIALALNVLAVLEGAWRYRTLRGPSDRRRVRVAMFTTVPGVLAYAIKEALPLASGIARPAALDVFLQALVLLPAFGVTYAVAVHRVLEPRVVIRRSLQYALAQRTLRIAAMIPAALLVIVLVRQRNMALADIVSRSPMLYIVLLAAIVAAIRYRERAQAWLDERFFRREYDAQKILVSLASRVRYETDPSELSALVVNQVDEALHPRSVAVMATGIDEGVFAPVAVLHGTVRPLSLDSALVAMTRWSDEPLEIYLDDQRSAARRLPPEDQTWLAETGVVLIVPVLAPAASGAAPGGQGARPPLIALIALGERRSEEPYAPGDRQLLASIATQMGLGMDIARLRRRMGDAAPDAAEALVPLFEPGIPQVIEGKYRVDGRIGRGGMGAVYRARDMRLERDVAIKVIRADLLHDPEARRRFRREAQIVARLQHPSIISIFDYGTLADGAAYLVMELVRGEDLRHVLGRERALDPARAARIITDVAGAVEAAHREGVLHRDLKPENIVLPGEGLAAKVLDFGVAKLIGDRAGDAETVAASDSVLTVAGSVVGTPAYMAPEQLRGDPLDARSDVFSLGVIAYEMLTGELPFGRGSLADIAVRQMSAVTPVREAARKTAHAASITAALEGAVLAALSKDSSLRPASPAALASLLNAGL